MKPLFDEIILETVKAKEKLPLECEHCGETFYSVKKEVRKVLNKHRSVVLKYCSKRCGYDAKIVKVKLNCTNCAIPFMKRRDQIKRSSNHFCSQSCSATHNNKNKTHGTRRSKLEAWLEEQLTKLYPELEIHFNRKDAIQSELDIYIPFLKLAFELNGIFHYEPIYGPEKLSQIQNNDHRKFQACGEAGISLCIIDSSTLNYFKPESAKKYLDIISNIISKNLCGL